MYIFFWDMMNNNGAGWLAVRPIEAQASQKNYDLKKHLYKATVADSSGSGKCIGRKLNILEVISIIFAGGFPPPISYVLYNT